MTIRYDLPLEADALEAALLGPSSLKSIQKLQAFLDEAEAKAREQNLRNRADAFADVRVQLTAYLQEREDDESAESAEPREEPDHSDD